MDYAALGRRVAQARKQQGWTQAVLAKRTGVSLSFIGHIERGSRVASMDSVVRIANALATGVDELLTDSLDARVQQVSSRRARLMLALDELKSMVALFTEG